MEIRSFEDLVKREEEDDWRFESDSREEGMKEDGRGELRTFEDLECWQAGRKLRIFAAASCRSLKQDEAYRLKDQVLRAARRITASIAEGYGRFHYQETAQYCRIARGSVYEVLDHFITGVDEGLFSEQHLAECRNLVETSVRLLNGYIRYLQSRKAADES